MSKFYNILFVYYL